MPGVLRGSDREPLSFLRAARVSRHIPGLRIPKDRFFLSITPIRLQLLCLFLVAINQTDHNYYTSMDQSFSRALWKYLEEQLKNLRDWLRPVPEDPLYLKIIKGFFKGLVLIVITALSPVIILILIITFLAAF